jgi:hypothetical protein
LIPTGEQSGLLKRIAAMESRFVVRADVKLRVLVELQAAIRAGADCLDKPAGFYQPRCRYKDLNPG